MTLQVFVQLRQNAASEPRRIVFARPEIPGILPAVEIVHREKIAIPVLLAPSVRLRELAGEQHVSVSGVEIVEPSEAVVGRYLRAAVDRWRRAGVGEVEARKRLTGSDELALAIVRAREADGVITGLRPGSAGVFPAASLTGLADGCSIASELFMVARGDGKTVVIANPATVVAPSQAQLAELALRSARSSRRLFGFDPHVAFLSDAAGSLGSRKRFQSAEDRQQEKVRGAIETVRARDNTVRVESHMSNGIESLGSGPNVLVSCGPQAGNPSYRLRQEYGAGRVVGPISEGLDVPVNVMSRGSTVEDIVDLTAVTSLLAGCG